MALQDLKCSWKRGGKTSFPIEVTAAEAIYAKSGRFISRNTSTGFGEIADTTDDLFGWIEAEEDTSSDSGAIFNCICDITAVFNMPLIYDNSSYTVNFSVALLGETCDIKVDTYQYCNPTAASNNSLIIVGGEAAVGTTIINTDGWVEVMMNPNAMHQLAVGA